MVHITRMERSASKYLTIVVQNHGHKLLGINTMPIDLHLVF